jgi:hypothetical protein
VVPVDLIGSRRNLNEGKSFGRFGRGGVPLGNAPRISCVIKEASTHNPEASEAGGAVGPKRANRSCSVWPALRVLDKPLTTPCPDMSKRRDSSCRQGKRTGCAIHEI